MLLSYVLRSQLNSKVKKLPDMFALQTQYFPNHGAARLAIVDYAPDGKGVSGKDDWRCNMFIESDDESSLLARGFRVHPSKKNCCAHEYRTGRTQFIHSLTF